MQSKAAQRRKMVVLILVFAGFFGVGNLLAGYWQKPSVEEAVSRGKPVNILVMGIDARNAEENSRSDTMIVASVDRKTGQAVMVWIPRDTRVEVSRNRRDRINSVNALEGPEAACQVAGKLLGTRIDYYVVTNFSGFEKIIDILGGVNIDVETDMRHYDPNPKLNINLGKGPQLLNGADALRYVRYRGGPTADIGRTARQQKFVNALARQMFSTRTIVKLPQLVPEIAQHIRTNIPASDMLFMMKVAREFDPAQIKTQTLPGYPFTDPRSGASYWEADPEIANGILDDLFNDQKYDVAQDPPNWVKPPAQPVTNELLNQEVPPEQSENQDIDPLPEDAAGPEGYVDEQPGENDGSPPEPERDPQPDPQPTLEPETDPEQIPQPEQSPPELLPDPGSSTVPQ